VRAAGVRGDRHRRGRVDRDRTARRSSGLDRDRRRPC